MGMLYIFLNDIRWRIVLKTLNLSLGNWKKSKKSINYLYYTINLYQKYMQANYSSSLPGICRYLENKISKDKKHY